MPYRKSDQPFLISNYKFVEDIDVKAVENPHKNLIGGFILGEPDFVNWIKGTFLSSRKEDKEAVIKKGMKRNKARDMAIYLSRNHSGITCKELGMYFGNVSGTTITMACNRVEKEITQNKRIKGKLNKIKI